MQSGAPQLAPVPAAAPSRTPRLTTARRAFPPAGGRRALRGVIARPEGRGPGLSRPPTRPLGALPAPWGGVTVAPGTASPAGFLSCWWAVWSATRPGSCWTCRLPSATAARRHCPEAAYGLRSAGGGGGGGGHGARGRAVGGAGSPGFQPCAAVGEAGAGLGLGWGGVGWGLLRKNVLCEL